MPTVLAATWRNGVFAILGDAVRHELEGHPVKSLASDGAGGAIAITGAHTLGQRGPDGTWRTLASSELELACCVAVGGAIYLGTDDARVLRVASGGLAEPLPGFDCVAGRDKWYAGAAIVNGRLLGPPLGIRSMSATCDGGAIFANVHVGGIPRSTDDGGSWHPTIDIDSDVHQVCAHPARRDVVVAAAAVGLCVSTDSGVTWSVEQAGLHAPYCSAVAFVGDDILVAASTDHFAPQGAIYRRPLQGTGPLMPVGGGLPRWLEGIADTGCIATREAAVAVADRAGNLHTSFDGGHTWSCGTERFPGPSSLVIL